MIHNKYKMVGVLKQFEMTDPTLKMTVKLLNNITFKKDDLFKKICKS